MSHSLVLIADDDPDFIAELTKILVDRGYLVLGARDGRAATELLTRHRLPLVSGMDLIKMLASNKGSLKIIAVSAGREKILFEAMSIGADAGIKKPPQNTRLDAKLWLDEVFLQRGLG